ncbi:MAG: CotH kinase family protein [Myxococcales bacterium]|nr:CotH kinase family protein [Myxococcales bacterium]
MLPARGYLVVFASGKDRAVAGAPLHTGFRLSGEGEDVALTDPDGRVLHALAGFPPQAEDVAFGLPMRPGRAVLLGPGAPGRLYVGPPVPGLTDADFDDSGWRPVAQGVGFDRRPPPRAEALLADSLSAFRPEPGAWQSGTWDRARDPDDRYDPADFTPFPANAWDGTELVLGPAALSAGGGRPGPTVWVIRRWIPAEDGAARLLVHVANPAAAGDGVVARVFVAGVEVEARPVDGDAADLRLDVALQAGQPVDFALDPGRARDARFDDCVFTARVVRPAEGLEALGAVVADSRADWSATGRQGAAGWTYGWHDAARDNDGRYTAADFEAFPEAAWGGLAWGGDTLPLIERDAMAPLPGRTAIRRWEATASGHVLVRWRVAQVAPDSPPAVARLVRGDAEVARRIIDADDAVGATEDVVLVDLEAGETVDFLVESEDHGAAVRFEASVRPVVRVGDRVRTDVGDALGLASTFWLRVPFEVPAGVGAVDLELAFDDGVVAWIDGEEVARENADPGTATDRPVSRALSPVRVPLGERPGPGVITLLAVDAAADDGIFFAEASLVAPALEVDDLPRYLPVPTPGAPNIVDPVDLGPVIFDVDRHQAVTAADPIAIGARVLPTSAPLARVELVHRVMYGEEARTPMEAAGDRFSVTLPPGAPGQMIRWAVEATDAAGRTSRFPPFQDPLDSEQYVGTVVADPTIESNLPVFHWFVETPERAATDAGARGSLWYDGELYDNIRVDLHGQATRSFPKNSLNFDFTRDHRFRIDDALERVKDFDLLTNYADKAKMRNTLSYGMFRDAGHDCHLAFPVRVQQNGAFFAVYELVEDPDERWLRRLGYTEPLGAVYKAYDNLSDPNRSEKKTREHEDNSDLAGFIAGISAGGDARRLYLYDNVDMAGMANFLAMLFLTAGMDCCQKNYYAYHDLQRDQWWYLPWDIDLTLGRNWTGNYFDDRMYPENPLYRGRGNRLVDALYALPEFDEMYLRRVRTLADALMQRPDTPYAERYLENEADRLLAHIGADGDLDNAAWPTWGTRQTQAEAVRIMKEDWMIPRRTYIYGSLVQSGGPPARVLLDGRPGATTARYLVPVDDVAADTWTRPDFDDGAWAEGPLGLGYEDGGADYAPFIGTRVRPQDVNPAATSVLLRVRFDVDAPLAQRLVLRMRYDDGYVAWLNGVEVARRGVPAGPLSWRSTAGIHDDAAAVRFEDVDVHGFSDALVMGENVLAIRLVNTDPGSSDLLVLPELVDGEVGGDGPLPAAQGPDPEVVIEAVEAAPGAPLEGYIVLHNRAGTAVDASGWRLVGRGMEHRLAPGTVLPTDGRLYVVANVPAFRLRAEGPSGGQGLYVQGNWLGVLGADGELRLEKGDAR